MNFDNFSFYKNRVRTARRMLKMKDKLSETIPAKDPNKTLIATWNIRAFDSKDYGARSIEAIYYIAQIIERFDIIAIQEVKEDLHGLERLMTRLGRDHWRYIVSDVSEGKPGNRERMAFIYDSRSVNFDSMVGEVVIPPKEIKEGKKIVKYEPQDQLYRTPYMCAFKVGWTNLIMCTVHILYGEDKANNEKRTREIAFVADFLAKRSKERNDYSNLVLLGDFNIFKPKDTTMTAMTDAGFVIDKSLQKLPATNIGKKARHYDQIAFRPKGDMFQPTGNAGVFNFFDVVYRDEDEDEYISDMGEGYHKTSKGKPRANKGLYYRNHWRTHQMSDHLPMWVQLHTNFSDKFLRGVIHKHIKEQEETYTT
jgi:endonuclease/exonuclease/phosphatase family metal-dependent hydrolase